MLSAVLKTGQFSWLRRCDLSCAWVFWGWSGEATTFFQGLLLQALRQLSPCPQMEAVFLVTVSRSNWQVLPRLVTLCIACGHLNWHNSLLEGYLAIYIKSLKNVDSPDSVIPPLGFYLEKIIRDAAKGKKKKKVCMRILIAVLVIMVKKKKNQKESIGTQLNNLWYFPIKE